MKKKGGNFWESFKAKKKRAVRPTETKGFTGKGKSKCVRFGTHSYKLFFFLNRWFYSAQRTFNFAISGRVSLIYESRDSDLLLLLLGDRTLKVSGNRAGVVDTGGIEKVRTSLSER
ncbi:hypothetical protein CIPAW_12G085700 [Carya illinoinensis]|uniref:Uncharacterized protein n=1 Tax=Carya illinoinensis TaxID=32201 RepID=A0A8T1NYW1_CARIL|nr:hypothetical protein CIPAW_12G085700 [Carya illinoinensis]